jgi:hypothetical protein
MPATIRSSRTRAGTGVALLAAFALSLGACSGVSSSAVPTVPPGGAASACLDAPTLAILDQLKADGADVPTILAANKDALIAGLNQFQPTDSTVVTWRDALVAGIRSDNADVVAAQVALLASSKVTIPAC